MNAGHFVLRQIFLACICNNLGTQKQGVLLFKYLSMIGKTPNQRRAAMCPSDLFCAFPFSLYLNLVLGNVNVTLLSNQAK